jgi:hypothetical protein
MLTLKVNQTCFVYHQCLLDHINIRNTIDISVLLTSLHCLNYVSSTALVKLTPLNLISLTIFLGYPSSYVYV